MNRPVQRLQPDHALEAAGYIRVSLERQAEGYSPEVQRASIKKLAAEQGYALTMIEEDHERGSKVSRVGYQKIIEAVRAGTIHAVLVFMFDRWGRDGAEWLTRAREFERLGVPIISVQEGKDEGGLLRFIRAGMAEEYSRQLAKRVLPGREAAARAGKHLGRAPLGYKKVYPAHEGSGRSPSGQLVLDEQTAWVARELFTRYAAGGCSLRGLAEWLNSDPRVTPPAGRGVWTSGSIKALLHNPTYIGAIRFNHRPAGLYERAPKDSAFTVQGNHEALVDQATFERVQQRMAAAALRTSYNRADDAAILGAGLLRCAACGGPMQRSLKADGKLYFQCGWRFMGRGCTSRAYLAPLAQDALLAQVRRLRGAPWTPQAERLLGARDTQGQEQDELVRQVGLERERMRKHTRLMTMLEDDPTPEQIAGFREVGAEISARIRALEARLAAVDRQVVELPNLRALHARLRLTEIPTLIDALAGDSVGLRELVHQLLGAAAIVERRPESHPTWLRAEVTWAPDVATLLAAGLLHLDPLQGGPAPLAPAAERQKLYLARYRERHREELRERNRRRRAREKARKLYGAE